VNADVHSQLGVLWLNLGGPEREEDVAAFLRNFLSDPDVMPVPWPIRPLLARRIATRRQAQTAAHYRDIGGGSPIGRESRRQAEALQQELGDRFAVRFAFRHSAPRTSSVIEEFRRMGLRRVIALPGYPQRSGSTTLSALKDFSRAARAAGMDTAEILSYPDAPGFVAAVADLARPFMRPDVPVLFCAHGLPERMVRAGDPYVEEVRRTVAAIAERLPAYAGNSLAFQSRMGRRAWTRPYLDEEIARLGRAGAVSVVLIPVSFVCENLETLYELDIELPQLARKSGVRELRRVPAPGAHPEFIRELARLVTGKVQESGWHAAGA
jgi:ferrochelatase